MIQYTPADIAKFRLQDYESKGIKKNYRSVYQRVLKEFQDGTIPSRQGTIAENGRVYRYTTDKLLQAKDTKDLQSLQVFKGSKMKRAI